jgi:Gpi18-like mannosyltransferase
MRAVILGPSGRAGLFIFLGVRILLTVWGGLIMIFLPPPVELDEALRPYLGEPVLHEGVAGWLLGPWQRFDTMRYLALAQEGYTDPNSVFPPLYPLLIRGVGGLMDGLLPLPAGTPYLLAALLIANLAALGFLILLHHITTQEMNGATATRAVLYLAVFPTAFFLFAAYTESLFLLLMLGAIWAARQDRPVAAGLLGFLAAMTRLTGWVLFIPLVYEYLRRREFDWRRVQWPGLALLLPPVAGLLFFAWRGAAGLAPLSDIYRQYWFQTTGFPGVDMVTSLATILTGSGVRAGELTLIFDFLCGLFLIIMTVLVFRRLGGTYGLTCLMLLLFMFLPTSELKPLYSFSRYALAFFPVFMLLGEWGRNPWINRLIFYPSVALLLYFSGQFFIWGWVA